MAAMFDEGKTLHCLASVFDWDLEDVSKTVTCSVPDRAAFVERSLAKLKMLQNEIDAGAPSDDSKDSSVDCSNSDERKQQILILKTLVEYLKCHSTSSFNSMPPDIVKFLPYLCYFENEATDTELKQNCHAVLIYGLGRCLLSPTNIDLLLTYCSQVAKNKWWKARASLLYFLQVIVISNLFHFCHPTHQKRVQELVFDLLKDCQIEVREVASTALCTFFLCRFLVPTQDIMDEFKRWASSSSTLTRHSGVLGMSSIILSLPYSVSSYLPSVIEALCQHVHGKPPISTSVKKTLSEFKRTHVDSWPEHMRAFNESQLSALTDALVSPSYYA
ncbi:unnamed protein product [Soboliphyme baturini]|uniref:DUF3437 domain-containing protein n=1 Tax=Soboliphyme baturini TaxID=241478 RepID=A0A183IEM5_9BILA|nr:unnamed protein product [Soboliphyme baturini]